MVVLALVSILAFAAAGILSAKVTSKESDVLIRGADCGFWVNPGPASTDAQDANALSAWRANSAEDLHLASTMAAACQKNSSVASDCVSYAPREIEWTTTTKTTCPFDPKICYQNTTVRFDTGLIDSTEGFGINAQKQDRLLYRNVVECTPLVREGYISDDWHDMNGTKIRPGNVEGNVLNTQPGEKWVELYYGPGYLLGLNSTFIYSDREPTVHMFGSQLWSLAATDARAQHPEKSSFIPIRELNRTDADINLLFLRQEMGLQYSKPVNDPWFEANYPTTRQYSTDDGGYKNVTIYSPEFPISVVGCTHQYQWCDPSTGSDPTCTDLGGLHPTWTQARQLFKRDKQITTLKRMQDVAGVYNDFSKIAATITGSVLQINKYGYYQLAAMKDDYWISELGHMFGTLMKVMQIRNYRFTGGYTSPMNIQPVITPAAANETWMCDAQMVRREDYQSLSVLGLAIICAFGALIILINLTLDSSVGWYQKRYNKRAYATREWEMLQSETLQQKLYKAHGVDLREGDVSVTHVLERLEGRRLGETMETLVERERELKSMASVGTLGKGSEVGVSVRRVSTERTLEGSPLSR